MNIIEWRDNLLESNLNYKAKFVGLVLSQFYRNNHCTYPSIRTLSQLSGLTVNPVQEGIKDLITYGHLTRTQVRMAGDRYLSNVYVFVNVDKVSNVSPRDTSNDTSNDTSPRDTEVDKEDKVDKVVSTTPLVLDQKTEMEWIKIAMNERNVSLMIATDWMQEFKLYWESVKHLKKGKKTDWLLTWKVNYRRKYIPYDLKEKPKIQDERETVHLRKI